MNTGRVRNVTNISSQTISIEAFIPACTSRLGSNHSLYSILKLAQDLGGLSALHIWCTSRLDDANVAKRTRSQLTRMSPKLARRSLKISVTVGKEGSRGYSGELVEQRGRLPRVRNHSPGRSIR